MRDKIGALSAIEARFVTRRRSIFNLDDMIYEAAISGFYEIKVRDIDPKDRKMLKMMGYRVSYDRSDQRYLVSWAVTEEG